MWLITLLVPAAAHATFEAAIEPFCVSIAAFEDDPLRWRIDGFMQAPPDPVQLDLALRLAALASGTAVPALQVRPIEPRDWLAENREDFAPLEIGRFFVYGAHDAGRAIPPGRIGLEIDAGPAFGSGRHATTAGCVLALEALAGRIAVRRALDVGCGSGILAVAIARLWPARVLATDLDPRAVAETRRNARRNGVGPQVHSVAAEGYRSPPVRSAAPYDLIAANILARPLIRMAGDLVRHLASGGAAVLSGFVASDAAGVLAAHTARGLRLRQRIDRDGWTTLVLHRPGSRTSG